MVQSKEILFKSALVLEDEMARATSMKEEGANGCT
jgi:hypothetical protein